MIYFAYGSNMAWGQMRDRCPSASFLGRAVLRDHTLKFSRESKGRGCGVADAVAQNGEKLWGVVYDIDGRDSERLDCKEGYDPDRKENSYWRRECLVFMENDDKRPMTVFAYFAEPQPGLHLPNDIYKQLIVSGAHYWHLPDDYIQKLERIDIL